MRKILFYVLFGFICTTQVQGQVHQPIIQKEEVSEIIKTLAADSMKGRKTFTPGIKKAADFITRKFEKIGLQYLEGEDDYRQVFKMIHTSPQKIAVHVGGQTIPSEQITAITTKKSISWTDRSDIATEKVEAGKNFFASIRTYLKPQKNTLVWVDQSYSTSFKRLKKYLQTKTSLPSSNSVVFVLSDGASDFNVDIENKQQIKKTANIVGVLPGDRSPNEIVIFGAHYDHLGTADQPVKNGDRIYNGANDNASGTTAIIELAKYFKAKGGNNRTLIFVAFTAEELGLVGSQYFSKQLNPDHIVAMFNIEMIGTQSKWGKKSVYITGFHKTNFGKILQENINGDFKFHPGPYEKRDLFYRSDNATLARLGVPAHTISTAQMKNPENYHKVNDEISALDLANMTQIIQAIANAAEGIVSGEDTPTRVEPKSLQ